MLTVIWSGFEPTNYIHIIKEWHLPYGYRDET
jgi:hypothetical protein